MRLSLKQRDALEARGQMSFVDTLEETIDRLLRDADINPEFEWSDVHIRHLKQAMLLDTLKQLRQTRLATRTRTELLDWISAPLKTHGHADPFSFQDCCIASDLIAEGLQNQLLRIVRS